MIRHMALADLHIDNKDILQYVSRGLHMTLEFAVLNRINLCTISGDLFNKELKSGDDALYYTLQYINRLCDAVIINNDGYVVIVEGTKTHDGDTLKLLEHLSAKYNNKLVIMREVSVCDCMYGDFKLTIEGIPHKYWNSKEELHKVAFNHGRPIDIILYHGDIDCELVYKNPDPAIGVKNIVAEPNWFNIARLYTCAGHIHTNHKFKDRNIWYVGELQARDFKSVNYHNQGFEYFEYNIANNMVQNKRILNIHSKQFISLDITADIIKGKTEDITTKLIYHLKRDNVSVRVTVDYAFMNMNDRNAFTSIKDKFSGKLAFEIKNNNVRLSAEAIKTMRDDAEFLLDKNTPVSDKILRVISSLEDVDGVLKMQLNSDRIEYLISTPLERLQ